MYVTVGTNRPIHKAPTVYLLKYKVFLLHIVSKRFTCDHIFLETFHDLVKRFHRSLEMDMSVSFRSEK